MKISLFIVFLFVPFFSFSQGIVTGEKELLSKVSVGPGENQISYNANKEGFWSPTGPMLDLEGALFFFPLAGPNARKYLVKYKNDIWSHEPLFESMKGTGWDGNLYQFISYGGYVISKSNDKVFSVRQNISEVLFERAMIKTILPSNNRMHYLIPSGDYFESVSPRWAYSAEVMKTGPTKIRNLEDTRAWLPTQPGGYSIGADGLLYQNGVLYSAVIPKEKNNIDWRYLGRLISGHTIWCPGPPEISNSFTIVNAEGVIELVVEIPVSSRFNYGLGPWGEFYFLFAPAMDKTLDPMNDYYSPEPGVPAELVVFRNHLKYFGRLNDGGVRLRKEPNTTSDILGTYPVKTGFRILERGKKEETIGGQKNVWCKVRLLDGKEGWFFGSFVHNLYDGPNGNPPPWPNVADW
ncbi:MAG: SH3 domain-containing protein [Treponemataceae bacterium]